MRYYPSILLITIFSSFLSVLSYAQKPDSIILHKQLAATRTHQKIEIDGDLNDEAWKTIPTLSNFVEWRPSFGKEENEKNKTEIKIAYDNNAIYISGFCHEATKDSISTELVGRDVIGVNDFVGVIFDTYNDKINGFGYYITPLGEQFDAKYSNSGEDGSWNSVYESATKIVANGWVFEMKIPYSAIRFSSKKIQSWGINITRKRSKSGQQMMWNPVSPTVNGFLTQFALWTGIENIKPPVRLSFSPYFSIYGNSAPSILDHSQIQTGNVGGGMDIKYGINQAMTLDMTLIPDFSQVQSDKKVLNLTPYEVKYNENRSFFTEGTELFSKGNLFYSRRIGGSPIHYYDAINNTSENEEVVANPTESKLINATKISGRMAKGLGIGIFNAVTQAQNATIEDSITHKTRLYQTAPLTNYNIIVFDQTLKYNSSVSFINTNVIRSGSNNYNANVTAGLWDLYDKKNNYNFGGKIAISQLLGATNDHKTISGYTHSIYFGKTSGRFNFNLSEDLVDNKYDQNDMGYLSNNNYFDHSLWIGYRWPKPNKWYNRLNYNFNVWHSTRFLPSSFQNFGINTNLNGQLKNLWYVGSNFNFYSKENDFYEPRNDGYVFNRPQRISTGFWFETNDAKKFAANGQYFIGLANIYNGITHEITYGNQYRFNKKLTISTSSNLSFRQNNLGYATTVYNDISGNVDSVLFALRKTKTIENILTIKYNFNNKMGLTINTRHYWSNVDNQHFLKLQPNGKLNDINYADNVNKNLNLFNVDLVYTWQFALGSFINIGWKNSIQSFDSDIQSNYTKNLRNILATPQNNTISLRIIYFLDYLNLKKKA